MDTPQAQCCPEYAQLSRRGFMKATGTAAAVVAASSWLPRVAVANSFRSTQRDTIIWIYLRGAADGLSICVPHAEDRYYINRPNLAVPRPGSGLAGACTDLDGFFGLPPVLSALRPAYTAGDLLFVQACGSPDPTRSHFEGQRFMEVGTSVDPFMITGWLGRHLATVAPSNPNAVLRGVGLGTGLQQSLVGGFGTIPVPDLDTFGLLGSSGTRTARTAALSEMYSSVGDPLQTTASTTLATISLLDSINFATYQPAGGAQYTATEKLGYALKTSAALIKAQVGVEAIAIDVDGWDTHSAQGNNTGTMAVLLTRVAAALSAFHTDMSASSSSPGYIVAVVSEFGRRLAENGSQGTDHGHGNCMMLMGQAINGGRVLTRWPGLDEANLYQGLDLEVTIDYRDVLSEVIDRRLGNTNLATVFPDYTPSYKGVLS